MLMRLCLNLVLPGANRVSESFQLRNLIYLLQVILLLLLLLVFARAVTAEKEGGEEKGIVLLRQGSYWQSFIKVYSYTEPLVTIIKDIKYSQGGK